MVVINSLKTFDDRSASIEFQDMHAIDNQAIPDLALGTVQLGMPYGIANREGRPGTNAAKDIIQTAWENNIRIFDTAQAYGESESVLGNALGALRLSPDLKIISKIHPGTDHYNVEAMREAFDASLQRLRVPRIHCLMLHREDHLDVLNNGLTKFINDLLSEGKIESLGISVYSPERAKEAVQNDLVKVIQIPTNILDRRYFKTGFFPMAHSRGKTIYIRSIYLQGLLTMNSGELSPRLHFAKPTLELFQRMCRELNMSQQQVALGFIKSNCPGCNVVIGAETPEQVRNNVQLWKMDYPEQFCMNLPWISDHIDERIINPSRWKA